VTELGARELMQGWRSAIESLTASGRALAGHADVPEHLRDPLRRQLELVEELVSQERRLQRELATHMFAPVDATFDLLEESGALVRRQAEALSAAGRALDETARLMRDQAELFQRSVETLRQPARMAEAAVALDLGREDDADRRDAGR
jgi:hypothetical protein